MLQKVKPDAIEVNDAPRIAVAKAHKVNRVLQQVGIDQVNVRAGSRVRKPRQILDL